MMSESSDGDEERVEDLSSSLSVEESIVMYMWMLEWPYCALKRFGCRTPQFAVVVESANSGPERVYL